jgi:hypothetical protein
MYMLPKWKTVQKCCGAVTGQIPWPQVLPNSGYAAHQRALEKLFAQRVQMSPAAATAGCMPVSFQ